MTTRRIYFLALGLIAMIAAAFPLPAAYAAESNAVSATSVARAAEQAKLAFVLDASGSMMEPDGGVTRLDTAKQVTGELVRDLPNNLEAGLLVYGSQESSDPDNQERGCRDIRTLAPVGKVDKEKWISEINGIEAKGYTPIGNSLLAARDALGTEGKRAIILVSDGIDTCAPPEVCEVAKQLSASGVDLAVHVVGFKVDDEARAQLNCITEATGGQYVDANGADELLAALRNLTNRAVTSYSTAGTPFEYADSPDEAKFISAGTYRTTAQAFASKDDEGATKYLRIAVPEGYKAYLSTTLVQDNALSSDNRSDFYATVDLSNDGPNSDSCTRATLDGKTLGPASVDNISFKPPESAVDTIVHKKGDSGCDHDAWIMETTVYSGAAEGGSGKVDQVEVELVIQFEPFVDGPEESSYPAGDYGENAPKPTPEAIDNPVAVSGGTGFSDAEELKAGSYSTTIVPGEYKFFRVPVNWGQNPVVSVSAGDSVSGKSANLYSILYAPTRNQQPFSSSSLSIYQGRESGAFSLDRPVLYNNRDTNWGGQMVAMAGDFYIGFSMANQDRKTGGQDQPFEFKISYLGDKVAGPDWRPTFEPGPTPSESPIRLTSDEEATSAPATTTQAEDAEAAAPKEESSNTGLYAGIGVGAVVLLALIAGLAAARRKK